AGRGGADARFRAGGGGRRRGGRGLRVSMEQWYADLAPLWLGLSPEPRRRLVLQTHVWITERLTMPVVVADSDEAEHEALRHRLERLVPPDDRYDWAGWIDTVVVTLLRAFDRPPPPGDGGGPRGVFLAPGRVGVPVARGASLNAS